MTHEEAYQLELEQLEREAHEMYRDPALDEWLDFLDNEWWRYRPEEQ